MGTGAPPIYGAWVPLSYNVLSFNATIAGIAWGGSVTWDLQFTLDDIIFERPVKGASQAGTTITVTDLGGTATNSTQYGPGGMYGHGMAAGDCVILKGFGSNMDGTYDIASVPSNNSYTVTSDISQTAAAAAGARVTPLRVWLHPTLQGITTPRTYGPICISLPPDICPTIVMAIRPRISAATGNLDFTVLHAGMGT
jgi:hypothetical protein